MQHGSDSTYVNHHCRCADCREAHRVYKHRLQARRVLLLTLNPDLVPHGKFSTYTNYGCRCDLCREARRRQRRGLSA